MCDVTRPNVWRDLFVCASRWGQCPVLCVMWLIHVYICDVTFLCVMWLVPKCDVTYLYARLDEGSARSYAWRDSFICVYMWCNSFLCVTSLVPMCDMTHFYVRLDEGSAPSYVWRDSFICVHVWCNAFICVTCLISMRVSLRVVLLPMYDVTHSHSHSYVYVWCNFF